MNPGSELSRTELQEKPSAVHVMVGRANETPVTSPRKNASRITITRASNATVNPFPHKPVDLGHFRDDTAEMGQSIADWPSSLKFACILP